ncbi:MAG: hypothetical protein LQ348_004750 [Seirophora lacunosa]|nr:MAG: hypothetical protein LQ348_004750 [Seirophora lacunosa]
MPREVKPRKVAPRPPTNPSLFLGLPGEIRDQVYRELLCSAKVEEPTFDIFIHRRYRFQVAILRCSRQTNIEATRVLYTENCLILIQLSWTPAPGCFPIMNWPPPQISLDNAGLTFLRQKVAVSLALTATVGLSKQVPARLPERYFFMTTPSELLTIAHQLSMGFRSHQMEPQRGWHDLKSQDLAVSLDFNLPDQHGEQTKVLIDGMLGFDGLSNIRTVKTTGFDEHGTAVLSSLIRARNYNDVERLARSAELESRADQYLVASTPNQHHLAYRCYLDGVTYLQENIRTPLGTLRVQELRDRLVWFNVACAVYQQVHGDKDLGLRWYDAWYHRLSKCSFDAHAKLHLYFSRHFVQASRELHALYPLWLALRIRPGWPVSLAFVDELDQRMRREPQLKARISFAFEYLVEPLRYKPPLLYTKYQFSGLTLNWERESAIAKIITHWPFDYTGLRPYDIFEVWL